MTEGPSRARHACAEGIVIAGSFKREQERAAAMALVPDLMMDIQALGGQQTAKKGAAETKPTRKQR